MIRQEPRQQPVAVLRGFRDRAIELGQEVPSVCLAGPRCQDRTSTPRRDPAFRYGCRPDRRHGDPAVNTPTTAAARMRRLRERRVRGCRVVQVEVDIDSLESLERLGLVGPEEADDPGALAFALAMLLEEAIESRIKMRDASRPAPARV